VTTQAPGILFWPCHTDRPGDTGLGNQPMATRTGQRHTDAAVHLPADSQQWFTGFIRHLAQAASCIEATRDFTAGRVVIQQHAFYIRVGKGIRCPADNAVTTGGAAEGPQIARLMHQATRHRQNGRAFKHLIGPIPVTPGLILGEGYNATDGCAGVTRLQQQRRIKDAG